MDHDVLHLHGVEDRRARLPCTEDEAGGHLDGIDRLVGVVHRNRRDAELVEDLRRIVLHHHLVHQHATAPGSAAGRQLRFEHGDLQSREREVPRRHETGRPRADDGDIHRQIAFEFLEITPDDRAGDCLFHHFHFIYSFFPPQELPWSGCTGLFSAPGDLPAAPRMAAYYTIKCFRFCVKQAPSISAATRQGDLTLSHPFPTRLTNVHGPQI